MESYNLTHKIVHELGTAIVKGEFNDIAFPTEKKLAEQFEASRTVIREAIKMLSAKGILSSRPRQGIRIANEQNWNLLDSEVLKWMLSRRFSFELLCEYTEVRQAIEPMAAYYAAQRAKASDLERIKQALKRMKQAEVGLDNPLDSDIAFHLSLLHASQNRFYIQFSNLIASALSISIQLTNKTKNVLSGDIAIHSEVYEHIANKDAIAAKQTMASIISEAKGLIIEAMQKQNED